MLATPGLSRPRPRSLAVRAAYLMTVTVLLFASYADVLGRSTVEVAVPSDGTVADVMAAVARLPHAGRLPAAPLVAVNQQYATRDQRLNVGDEVAIIPPVAGG